MQPQLQPYPEAAPAHSGPGGLLSIFYSPSDAFTSGKRAWVLPLAATCLVVLLMNVIVIHRVGFGTIVRNQMESNTRIAEQLGPEGINQQVARIESSTVHRVMSYAGAPVGVAVVLAALAGVAFGILILTGGITTYGAVLTVSSWAAYAASAVTCAGLTAVVYSMSDFSGVDVGTLFALNAGIFAAEGRSVLRALLSGIDLIAAWTIFLETVGITKLSQRVSVPQALTAFISLHVLITLLKAGWAALFG
jgi:hypothetical protein